MLVRQALQHWTNPWPPNIYFIINVSFQFLIIKYSTGSFRGIISFQWTFLTEAPYWVFQISKQILTPFSLNMPTCYPPCHRNVLEGRCQWSHPPRLYGDTLPSCNVKILGTLWSYLMEYQFEWNYHLSDTSPSTLCTLSLLTVVSDGIPNVCSPFLYFSTVHTFV